MQRIPNTELGTNPTFSPDGQWIAFEISNDNGGIFKVPVAGGTRLPVVAPGGEPQWTEDDQIVYRSGNEILTVPAVGGEPQLLFRADSIAPRRPHLLPQGRAVLFGTGVALSSRIMLYDLGAGLLRELSPMGNQPRFVRTGHVLYASGEGSLMAMPFDLETLTTSGSPVSVQTSLRVGSGGASQFAVSDNGTLVYQAGAGTLDFYNRRLVWVNRDGSEEEIGAGPQLYVIPRVSPDGTRAAVSVDDIVPGQVGIWVWNFVSGNGRPLTLGEDRLNLGDPVWSEDGTRIVYAVASGRIYSKAANNTGTPQLLAEPETGADARRQVPYFFAPGGRSFVYKQANQGIFDDDLVMWSLDGDSAVWRLAGSNAVLHPSGRWMAYHSAETRQIEVYVRPFPNVHDDQVMVSSGGGADPVWSADGRELFYLPLGGDALMSVSVDPVASNGASAFGERTELMAWPYACNNPGRCYDVAPDGRFLAIASGETGQDNVYIVTNWFEELRERVGN
jgi:serine/threonine-protein kinase